MLAASCELAIEIKRIVASTMSNVLRAAIEDIRPGRTFMVHGGERNFPLGDGMSAITSVLCAGCGVMPDSTIRRAA